jgi:uncharacterized BrkB/YihY/UPF0761 family membrane protein
MGKRINSIIEKLSAYQARHSDNAFTSNFIGVVIVALITLVVAVVLIPVIVNSSAQALGDTNLTKYPSLAPVLSLISIVPLVFVAGVIMIAVYMLLEKRE